MNTATRRRKWPRGTWMKLISAERLTAFVGAEPDKKMSRRMLASLVPCHPSFIDHLTSGRKTSCEPKTAQRIAEVLGVPLEILFDPNVPTSAPSTAKQSSVRSSRAKTLAGAR